MSQELKLLSRSDVEKVFQSAENVTHLDVDVPTSELEFRVGGNNQLLFNLDGNEYNLHLTGLYDLACCLGIPRTYVGRCPTELLLQNLQYWGKKGNVVKLRMFLRDNAVVGCVTTRKPYYSSSQILGEVEKQIGPNNILGYHRVNGSLEFVDFSVVVNKSFEIQVGDTLFGGIEVQNSTKGEHALEIAPYIFRQVCINGAIAAKNTGRWSSRNDPSEIDVWAQSSTRQALQSIDQEFERIQKLVDVRFNGHSKDILRSIFSKFGISQRIQEEIVAETVAQNGETGPQNMYDLWNAITRIATHSGRLSPVSSRQLQLSAGALVKKFSICPSCHQLVGN